MLSAFRLNARLCVLTGLIAGLQYSILAWYFANESAHTLIEPILTAFPHHLVRSLLLLITGVVTGLVTLQIKKRVLNSFVVIESAGLSVSMFQRKFAHHPPELRQTSYEPLRGSTNCSVKLRSGPRVQPGVCARLRTNSERPELTGNRTAFGVLCGCVLGWLLDCEDVGEP